MKFAKLKLAIGVTLVIFSASQAIAVPLLNADLNSQSIFGHSYVTLGAGAKIYGGFLTGAGATLGANSIVTGSLLAAEAATIGLGGAVGGNLLAGAGATLGASSSVAGSFQAGAGVALGANSTVGGNLSAGSAATLGVGSKVGGNLSALSAVTLGAGSQVSGNLVAGGAVGTGFGAVVLGTSQHAPVPAPTGLPTTVSVDLQAVQVATSQTALHGLASGTTLGATMGGQKTLNAGTYDATALTMAASTALMLDGQNLDNQLWVFNIDTYLVTGADTKISLINAGKDNSIIWNTGGYTTMGASTSFLGTLFSAAYISMGANTMVTGPNDSCGGIFSASYVVLGANAQVGSLGCSGATTAYWKEGSNVLLAQNDVTAVPEPETYAMMLAGLGLMSTVARRRLSKQA